MRNVRLVNICTEGEMLRHFLTVFGGDSGSENAGMPMVTPAGNRTVSFCIIQYATFMRV